MCGMCRIDLTDGPQETVSLHGWDKLLLLEKPRERSTPDLRLTLVNEQSSH
jgi:hypothetical protein